LESGILVCYHAAMNGHDGGMPLQSSGGTQIPLAVDLDGTLLTVNSLYECAVALVRSNPLYLFILPFWLLQGQAILWRKIMDRIQPNPEWLPYREQLLARLRPEAPLRPLVLVTGADQRFAELVAKHLGIFSLVRGSSGGVHLTGVRKREVLISLYGERGFDYIGDSAQDIPVWAVARKRYCVAPDNGSRARMLRKVSGVECIDCEAPGRPRDFVRLVRAHQWTKNALVFAPVISSHRVFSAHVLPDGMRAFAAFCCCASAAYILNDLMDLESDRRHPTKRFRPLAAARVPIPSAAALAALLLVSALAIGSRLPAAAQLILAVYLVATMLYSGLLKRIVLIDVFSLASLYSLRVLGGGAATGIVVSAWTIAFFMFLFLSLALLKRYTEIAKMEATDAQSLPGRGYRRDDIEFVSQCGVGSGLVSVLVFSLYINSLEVHALYRRPELLWFLGLVVAYWILSMWLAGHRGRMHDDPIVFAAKSPTTYVLGGIGALIIVAASL
jgi:4-hydroxybenzoate polyprenyltransferase